MNIMNYTIILRPAAWLVVLGLLSGCGDFLSESPDNRATLDSQEKLAELLVTAYPETNYAMFCEAMSDNVEDNPAAPQDPRNADPYFWRDGTSTAQDTPEDYWNGCYKAIAAANHALEYINNSGTPELFAPQKGEALVARAYAHFMLVTLFAKTYNPNTAGADPGIPYVTDPEEQSFKNYERKTVEYVYSMIEQDLTEGLPLIDDKAYMKGESSTGVVKYHFTQMAAHTFASRFYLFKRDYAKVLEHCNAAIPSGEIRGYLRPWNTTYKSYSATELLIHYTKATETANILLCETLSDWTRTFSAQRYATGALRYQEIFNENPAGGEFAYSVFYRSFNVYFVNKFREHFVQVGLNANTGYVYTIMPLFTAEEVLFNRAEAYAMQKNLGTAVQELDIWASTRIVDYSARNQMAPEWIADYYYGYATSNQDAVVKAILAFRRVEFLHEGMRWFDILRHNLPVKHNTYQGEVLELKPNDPRRVLQLPREAVTTGGLPPNAR
ncbi:RagB/SusD family nutrient uptake outer membrane protein [Dawidia soli]|uniref:RagB/SusD family nutrient uptake outer membrane protein n=1 Tax=Dawidia soli TaxID=2782352 RepID=A0AAP2GE41_9BACT|nr:RagB/SusD family nutrient uptake outer membrane protein [Dawidia soli]MBT1687979.1 RagB/SusD family nutrient uptake outer membrane protein [Dawidia soli]